MAIQYATGIVAGSITSLLTPLTNNLQQGLTSAIQNNITTPISNAWGEGQLWVSQQTYSMIDAGTIPQQYMSDPALQMLQNSDNGNMAAPLTIDNSVPYTPE